MKKKNIGFLKYIPFVLLMLLLSACATNKNTLLRRGWHNMNARYNGYFYSRENFKDVTKKVEKSNKDDFTKIVPMFIYPDNTTAKNYYSDYDKTIKKSSVVIQRHAITTKKTKEEIPNACRWIDENYVLIGKAHFYKRDFFSALEAFEYVSKKYPKPEAKYTGMLWMVRTNNEIGSYSQSEPIIDQLRTAKDFPQERAFQQELAAVTADYYIKTADYGPAIKSLTKALTLTKNRKVKARFTFVLAQLYEKEGDNKKASMYYGMVPKLHPQSYDMEFNARINRARLYDVESPDIAAIKKELSKMLRDDKNNEYQDQIYYVLADIAYREKQVPDALVLLGKSVRTSTINTTQKALSYLKRADIYFEQVNYPAAEANYDSTMSILPKEYPDYKIISEKKKSLTALVNNLKTIAMEDSLQRLAAMSESERNKSIDKLMAQIEENEKKAEEQRQQEQSNVQLLGQGTPTTTSTTNTGLWYFYNPATISFGIADFTKKWGNRKLEDNWRRAQKDQVLAAATTDDNDTPKDTVSTKDKEAASKNSKNKKDRSFYLKNVPLTPEALAKSNDKVIEAYYNVGSIYKEQLQNNTKSVQALEELVKRYPENKYKLSSYYQLYRTYLVMKEQAKSDYYKNLLLDKYPESEYAKIIKNPDAAKDIAASRNVVERFYSETYQLYSEAKYNEALVNCQQADTMYSKSYLMPQFAFLKALCIGRTQDINAFEGALVQVTIKYPKEPVKEKAQQLLDLIKKQKNPGTATADVPKDTVVKAKFVFNETGEYYWVTIVENGKGDINKFKTGLSDLNEQSFSLQDLTINSVFLDITHQLISVKTFDGKSKAMDYYNFMKGSSALVFKDLLPGTYQSFIISAENYPAFYKDKNVQEYQTFFTQNFK
ncbi:MAG: tol-pal system protein YbgF [Bacteroidetes bacterium]|nr:tol-pal system protein YbgF [Bacteroidota bacterium]